MRVITKRQKSRRTNSPFLIPPHFIFGHTLELDRPLYNLLGVPLFPLINLGLWISLFSVSKFSYKLVGGPFLE